MRLHWRRRAGPIGSADPTAMATLTSGTITQGTKLPLTTWFMAFYLIRQAKTGIASPELSRHLGVKYDTA